MPSAKQVAVLEPEIPDSNCFSQHLVDVIDMFPEQKICSWQSIYFDSMFCYKWYKLREFGYYYRTKFAKNSRHENLEMSKLFVVLVMFFSLLSSHIAFADPKEEAELKCRAVAEDQEITREEMSEFMEECVKELIDQKK